MYRTRVILRFISDTAVALLCLPCMYVLGCRLPDLIMMPTPLKALMGILYAGLMVSWISLPIAMLLLGVFWIVERIFDLRKVFFFAYAFLGGAFWVLILHRWMGLSEFNPRILGGLLLESFVCMAYCWFTRCSIYACFCRKGLKDPRNPKRGRDALL